MTTQTAEKVIAKITENAKTSTPELRHVKEICPGLVERQGDIYVLHLGDFTTDKKKIGKYLKEIKEKAKPHETTLLALPETPGKKTTNRQLATGNTQGSRHVAQGDDLLIFAAPEGANVLIGPIIISDRRFLIEHPEHAHDDMSAGCYQILYQRDFAVERAEELRRVQD